MFIIIASNFVLSILFAQTVFHINLYLLFSTFFTKKVCYRPELLLIYCKIAADICYSFTVSIMKSYFLVILCYKHLAVKNLSIYMLETSVTMGIIKGTFAFMITLERFISVFFPIHYRNNRRKIPFYWIIIPILGHILFDHFIMFCFCGNVREVPLDCDNFQCTFNKCYQRFWETRDQVVFSLIEIMSVLFFVRLYIWKRTSRRLSKVTQIALLDSLIYLFFNVIPIILYSHFSPTSVKVNYPPITISRNAGSVIESIILWRLLKAKKKVTPNKYISGNL
ncbi:Serpentine Receptor, class BC (Class B-like) [Caenorhabditis elegans]|uniref:Serpentine Receptor, class BC (Class B-like) n=1 Tax=Caenorhabditis elegans TaxID=6239 RepID=Q5CZ33_CAEEL|nr:Serpentine Receptor, class BC (Class B-like) [Caenorhabditis elegans]CAI58635.1 Serpentine Receptor, class BC (Class B-like) [Caenorhabditis elegans]|eukprot:NP_001023965.1 Serpentine Receptor, class BC (class B-like) [Caenorhabditis elegans]